MVSAGLVRESPRAERGAVSEPDQRLDEFPARRGHLELSDGPEEYLDLWVRPKPPPSASYDAPPTEPTSIVLAAPEMPARRRPLRVFLVAVLVAVLAVGAGLGAGHLLSGAGLPFLPDRKSTSELQSPYDLVCRLLLEKKKKQLNT